MENPQAGQFHQHWINNYYAQSRALGPKEIKVIKAEALVLWNWGNKCMNSPARAKLFIGNIICLSEDVVIYQKGHKIWIQNAWI